MNNYNFQVLLGIAGLCFLILLTMSAAFGIAREANKRTSELYELCKKDTGNIEMCFSKFIR